MIESIAPAENWFLRHVDDNGTVTLMRIAAWGKSECGQILGLVPDIDSRGRPYLVPSSELYGEFVHANQIPLAERMAQAID